MVILGGDSIDILGNVSNKTGSYLAALVAKTNNVPFYISCHQSKINRNLHTQKSQNKNNDNDNDNENDGEEEMESYEITKDWKQEIWKNMSNDTKQNKLSVKNVYFEKIPANYITGIGISEGIIPQNQFENVFGKIIDNTHCNVSYLFPCSGC